jgi:peptide subunit release factor RF-3
MDREGKDAFDPNEVEQKLGLTVTPLSFPIGMGYDFQVSIIYGNKTSIYLAEIIKKY